METTAQAADRRSDVLGRRGEDLAADYLAGTGLVGADAVQSADR